MKSLRELLELEWNGRESMVKHCLDNSIYVQSGEAWIDCGSRKPTIDSEIYYDDETPTPKVDFETFKRYNQKNMPRRLEDRHGNLDGNIRRVVVYTQYNGDKTGGLLMGMAVQHIDDRPITPDQRNATPEEVEKIREAIELARKDYEKRLERYWKRYSDKVTTHGYWANR